MSDIIFKSEVKGNTDHGWDVVGHVDSTYLKVDGEYVINPSTGNPLMLYLLGITLKTQ